MAHGIGEKYQNWKGKGLYLKGPKTEDKEMVLLSALYSQKLLIILVYLFIKTPCIHIYTYTYTYTLSLTGNTV